MTSEMFGIKFFSRNSKQNRHGIPPFISNFTSKISSANLESQNICCKI